MAPIKGRTQTIIPNAAAGLDSITSITANSGVVAFRGVSIAGNQEAVYLLDAKGLRVVADRNTNVPRGDGTFSAFQAPGDLALSNGDVVFTASDATHAAGIYHYTSGTLRKVVDTHDAIPNGTGTFTGFAGVTLDNAMVAFLGFGNDGQQGIYVFAGETLLPVVTAGNQLAGRTVEQLDLHNEAMDAGGLAFVAYFTDGSSGLVLARRREPSIRLDGFSSTSNNQINLRYTISDGPLNPLEISFSRSPVAAFATSSVPIGSLSIDAASELTSGVHERVVSIGGGSGQVALPGAGSAEVDEDYFLVAATASSSIAFTALYHIPGGSVFLHGSQQSDDVRVSEGSVRLEWNNQTFVFDNSDTDSVRVRTHQGDDRLEALQATVDIWGWTGGGTDELIAGSSSRLLDGGAGDDVYRLRAARSLDIIDRGGVDQLDFSAAVSGITIDLDLQADDQQLNVQLQVRVNGQFENLIGTDFSDQIFVRPLPLAERYIDLRANLSDDDRLNRVHFNAAGSPVHVVEPAIQADGFKAVTLSVFEILLFDSVPTLHRPHQPTDVSNDGLTTPLDALLILTRLSLAQRQAMTGDTLVEALIGEQPQRYYDVDNNGQVEPLDALTVLIQIAKNNRVPSNGEMQSARYVTPLLSAAPITDHRQTKLDDSPIPFSGVGNRVTRTATFDNIDRVMASIKLTSHQ